MKAAHKAREAKKMADDINLDVKYEVEGGYRR